MRSRKQAAEKPSGGLTGQEGPTPEVLVRLLPGYFGLPEDERPSVAEELTVQLRADLDAGAAG